MTDPLVAFLRARLDADTVAQNDADDSWHDNSCQSVPSRWRSEVGDCDCGIPQRALADIAAKRAIVDAFEAAEQVSEGDEWDASSSGLAAGLRQALGHLARVYVTHPDYRKEWTP